MIAARLKKLRTTLDQPLLISKKENLLYLTGRSFIDGFLLVFSGASRQQPVYFGNGLERARGIRSDYLRNITKYMAKHQVLQVEPSLRLEDHIYLKRKLKGIRIRPAPSPVDTLRRIKTASELALMREAYKITAQVFVLLKRALKTRQWTEQGLANYIRIWGLELGAQDISFEPIVASGPNAAIPHHNPTGRILKAGESIVLDFGFKYQGYCSDFTRTVFIKRAPKPLANLYNHTEIAYRKAFAAAASGITGEAVDAVARDYLGSAKLAKHFIHSLGHGTGLEVHEYPYLGQGRKDTLQNGMVFSIEPGVYISGLGGIRIEDLVYFQGGQPHYFAEIPTDIGSNIIK